MYRNNWALLVKSQGSKVLETKNEMLLSNNLPYTNL